MPVLMLDKPLHKGTCADWDEEREYLPRLVYFTTDHGDAVAYAKERAGWNGNDAALCRVVSFEPSRPLRLLSNSDRPNFCRELRAMGYEPSSVDPMVMSLSHKQAELATANGYDGIAEDCFPSDKIAVVLANTTLLRHVGTRMIKVASRNHGAGDTEAVPISEMEACAEEIESSAPRL